MAQLIVYYAHPGHKHSHVNRFMARAAVRVSNITFVDLYADYPRFDIDVDIEQRRLLDHDVILFQFPVFWYSTPSIIKEWQDLVLEYGFAYGREGTALNGKLFLCAITAGGKEEAYQTDGFNHFKIGELLQPIEQMARLTGMKYLPPFALFGARSAVEENRIDEHVAQWRNLLTALVNETLDPAGAEGLETLDYRLDTMIKGDRS